MICLCMVNVAFMHYIHISWGEMVDGGSRGLNYQYDNIYIVEEGYSHNDHLAIAANKMVSKAYTHKILYIGVLWRRVPLWYKGYVYKLYNEPYY